MAGLDDNILELPGGSQNIGFGGSKDFGQAAISTPFRTTFFGIINQQILHLSEIALQSEK